MNDSCIYDCDSCLDKLMLILNCTKILKFIKKICQDKIMFEKTKTYLIDKKNEVKLDHQNIDTTPEFCVVKIKFYYSNTSQHYRDYGAEVLLIESSIKECYKLLLCPFRRYKDKLKKLTVNTDDIEKLFDAIDIKDNNDLGIVNGNIIEGILFDTDKCKNVDKIIRIKVYKHFINDKLSNTRQLFEYFHYNC